MPIRGGGGWHLPFQEAGRAYRGTARRNGRKGRGKTGCSLLTTLGRMVLLALCRMFADGDEYLAWRASGVTCFSLLLRRSRRRKRHAC